MAKENYLRLVYACCVKYNWFNNGTNESYRKLLALAEKGTDLQTLSMLIWLCTDNAEKNEILKILKEEKQNYLYVPNYNGILKQVIANV